MDPKPNPWDLYIISAGWPEWYKETFWSAILVYRKISNMIRTKSPNLNVSGLVLQLSLPNPVKPGVKSRMKM